MRAAAAAAALSENLHFLAAEAVEAPGRMERNLKALLHRGMAVFFAALQHSNAPTLQSPSHRLTELPPYLQEAMVETVAVGAVAESSSRLLQMELTEWLRAAAMAAEAEAALAPALMIPLILYKAD
jgi:hypothetical protein